MKQSIIICALALAAVRVGGAQDKAPTPASPWPPPQASAPIPSPAPAVTPAPAPVPGHAQALKLLELMDTQQNLSRTIDLMLKSQIQQKPQLAPYESLVRQFLEKYIGWPAVKDSLADSYAQVFTEPELDQLIAFYETPLGRKVVTSLPDLQAQGIALGQQRMHDHMSELQDAITQRAKELERESPASPAKPN